MNNLRMKSLVSPAAKFREEITVLIYAPRSLTLPLNSFTNDLSVIWEGAIRVMEKQEKYLGHVPASTYFRGFVIIATTKRLIGVKRLLSSSLVGLNLDLKSYAESKLKDEEADKLFKDVLKSVYFEIKKDNIKAIRLKKPSTLGLRSGHFDILSKSGNEIKLRLATPKAFRLARDMIQAFYPEALKVEDDAY
jgi:hypothetical protein